MNEILVKSPAQSKNNCDGLPCFNCCCKDAINSLHASSTWEQRISIRSEQFQGRHPRLVLPIHFLTNCQIWSQSQVLSSSVMVLNNNQENTVTEYSFLILLFRNICKVLSQLPIKLQNYGKNVHQNLCVQVDDCATFQQIRLKYCWDFAFKRMSDSVEW